MSATQRGHGVIVVNGREQPPPNAGDMISLLQELGIGPEEIGVAVAVNGEVLPREEWGSVCLAAGDQVEVLRAVQGG